MVNRIALPLAQFDSSPFRAGFSSGAIPPPYPVRLPLAPMTRWHGTMMPIGLWPLANPTARERPAIRSAVRSRRTTASRRRGWSAVPPTLGVEIRCRSMSRSRSNSIRSPAKYASSCATASANALSSAIPALAAGLVGLVDHPQMPEPAVPARQGQRTDGAVDRAVVQRLHHFSFASFRRPVVDVVIECRPQVLRRVRAPRSPADAVFGERRRRQWAGPAAWRPAAPRGRSPEMRRDRRGRAWRSPPRSTARCPAARAAVRGHGSSRIPDRGRRLPSARAWTRADDGALPGLREGQMSRIDLGELLDGGKHVGEPAVGVVDRRSVGLGEAPSVRSAAFIDTC